MEYPFGATPSPQEDSPGNSVTQGPADWKSWTSPSHLDPDIAQQDAEASRYGSNLPQEIIPHEHIVGEDYNIWRFGANAWTASGNVPSDDFHPLPTGNPATLSWSPGLHMQNDVYNVPSSADPIPEPWNATLYMPGHSPHRIQDDLVGLLPGFYQDDYNAHAPVQEYNNGSDISSLSSSFIYNTPEPQGPVAGHELPAPVPWSRPNTLGDDHLGRPSWTQNSTWPDQLGNSSVSEQAVEDHHSSPPGHVTHTSQPEIAINGHQIVWNSLDGQEVNPLPRQRRRSSQQLEQTRKIRKRGACRACRKGRRKVNQPFSFLYLLETC